MRPPTPSRTTVVPSGRQSKRLPVSPPSWSIVRTSIVYGWPLQEHRNFAPWLIGRLRSGQPYHAPADVLRTPVYVEHLADGIARLVEGDYPGTHHIAGSDWASMYDFALAVADGFNVSTGGW